MPSKKVPEILSRIGEIHERKNHDYSQAGNSFSNFERMGVIASWFDDSTHKAFATMIGVKLARLAELLSSGKTPRNESIDDSFLDLATYCVLFHAYYLELAEKNLVATQREEFAKMQNMADLGNRGFK